MVSFKSAVTALILIQLSIGIVNLTGIFPVQEDVDVVPQQTINDMREDLNQTSNDENNIIDYFGTLGKVVYRGLSMAVTFIGFIFTGVPTILKLFYIPDAIADLIGYAVDALVILGVAYKLFNRGG
ncbi:hypothetical protein [Methanolobus sp. ZRKC5]|uniref:hypothetical protein n=1 Tax=unclassified Methanolobus TaxID=2629569 RepID=UPI00313B13DA